MDRCLDWLRGGIERWRLASATRRAEAELRALDPRELLDIGLDRGGIHHAVRHGRAEADVPAPRPRGMRPDGFNVRSGP